MRQDLFQGAVTSSPLIVVPEGVRVYRMGGGEGRILVSSEQSHGKWWLGSFQSDPGRLTGLHVHHHADEQFYVVDGIMSLWTNGQWQALPKGSFAAVPHGVPHALGNRSERAASYLVFGNPAGFERYFEDLEALIQQEKYGTVSFFEQLKHIYLKYDSELLGPPPE